MTDFKRNGYTYELIIKACKKGKSKYEAIRWVNGFRNLWERISYEEYQKIKSNNKKENGRSQALEKSF